MFLKKSVKYIKRAILIIVLCVCSILFLAHRAYTTEKAFAESERDITRMWSEKQGGEYSSLVRAIAINGTKEELVALRSHDHWGLSLQVAWTTWVDDRRGLFGERTDSRLREEVLRWIGFTEARLGFEPPLDWLNDVSSPRLVSTEIPKASTSYVSHPVNFSCNRNSTTKLVEILPGLYSQPGLKATRTGSIVEFESTNLRPLRLNLKQMECVPLNDDDEFSYAVCDHASFDTVDVLILRQEVLGCYNISIRRKDKEQAITSEVGGGGDSIGTRCGWVRDVSVSVRLHRGAVYVFGSCSCAVYIDSFDLKSGKRTGRFSSTMLM